MLLSGVITHMLVQVAFIGRTEVGKIVVKQAAELTESQAAEHFAKLYNRPMKVSQNIPVCRWHSQAAQRWARSSSSRLPGISNPEEKL